MSSSNIVKMTGIWLSQWTLVEAMLLLAVVSMGMNCVLCLVSGQTSIRQCIRPFVGASMCLFGSAAGGISLLLALGREPLVGPDGPVHCVISLSCTLALMVLGLTIGLRQYWPSIPNPGWVFVLGLFASTTALAWLAIAL